MILLKIFLTLFLTIISHYSIIFIFLFLKRKADFYNGKVVQTTNLWALSFQILLNHFQVIKRLVDRYYEDSEKEKLEEKKREVLKNVVNHLNETIFRDLGLKTTNPADINGPYVLVYLVNNLNNSDKNSLEEYFAGVLSKYTDEFGLDTLVVELNAGAGWVAKCDVKLIEDARYNRMARQSSVENEEDF